MLRIDDVKYIIIKDRGSNKEIDHLKSLVEASYFIIRATRTTKAIHYILTKGHDDGIKKAGREQTNGQS